MIKLKWLFFRVRVEFSFLSVECRVYIYIVHRTGWVISSYFMVTVKRSVQVEGLDRFICNAAVGSRNKWMSNM